MLRFATLISLATGALLAVFVFAIKYEVQDLEHEFQRLSRSIERERQAIHVLTAEWSHLNEPARLRTLARSQLGLDQIGVDRLGELESLPLREPNPDLIDRLDDDAGVDAALAAADPPAAPPVPPRVAPAAAGADAEFDRIEAALNAISSGGPPE